MLINRLMDHVLSKCDMPPSQVRAAQLVLRKILPDLKPVKVEYESPPTYVDVIRAASYRYDQHKIAKAQKAEVKRQEQTREARKEFYERAKATDKCMQKGGSFDGA
jgi:flagellar biosynthesis/type III secretory pathway protein FliH